MDFLELLKSLDTPIGIVVLFLLAGVRRDQKAQHHRLIKIERRLWPENPDATPPQGPGIIGGAAALLFVALLILPGCTLSETRSTSSSTGTLVGSIDGKPVELHFAGGSEAQATQTVDSAAIAASVGKAVGSTVAEAVKAAVPGAEQVAAMVKAAMPPAQPDDTGGKLLTGAVGTAAAAAIAAMLRARRERELADYHRDDADQAWSQLTPSSAPKGA